MKSLTLVVAALGLWSGSGRAAVLAESDPGVVFGDVLCPIVSHVIDRVRFYEGDWDELAAAVDVTYVCYAEDGARYTVHGRDDVLFPTLTFDYASQSWKTGDATIATRLGRGRVALDTRVATAVRSDHQETAVSFNVQITD
jgi:hypothetical protein